MFDTAMYFATTSCGLGQCFAALWGIGQVLTLVTSVESLTSPTNLKQEIEWRAKTVYLRTQLTTVRTLAADLSRNWPTEDGELIATGPFSAYPHGAPSMLVLWKQPAIGLFSRIVAIDYSSNGIMRFQLKSDSRDDWLEWHPTTAPAAFMDGLEDFHAYRHSSRLMSGWYLVRYE